MKNDETPRKRGKYVTEKSVQLDNLLVAAKEYSFQYKPKAVNLKKDFKDIAELTDGSCLYPNRYLDNDDSCIKCHIYEYCSCSIKNLGKKRK